ncbi:MAG: hypothetical protein PHV20_10625 [Bacteroidales bacterium]|nr:hypothetical protein [Bacteroidales bacterium]
MDKKEILKWSAATILILSVCVAAFIVYERFADENSAATTDLMQIIPDHCDAFLSVDKFEQLDSVEQNSMVQSYLKRKASPSLLKTLSKLRPMLSKAKWSDVNSHLHEMIISFHSWEKTQAELLLFKMAAGDKEEVEKILNAYFQSSFTPLTEKNAGITVTHYYVSTGIKFHCFFYKGIFAGSFNNRLIDEAIVRMKQKKGENSDRDFMDIAAESQKSSSLKFFIRLNGIPLHYGNNSEQTDTLNLAEWVAPELTFEKDKLTLSCYTSPQFESKNWLSFLIGQTPGRPLNPAVIAKDCPFCIHYGLSDRERFNLNQQAVFGVPEVDSTLYRADFLSIDSLFNQHFDSEINIAYYPVNVPEKQYQKIIVIRLKNEEELNQKLGKLYDLTGALNEKNAPDRLGNYAFPDAFISSVFGKLFSLNEQTIYCNVNENYLIVAARPEVVNSYIKVLKAGQNISSKIWYHEVSGDIDSKSNLYFIGGGSTFIEDRYILPFGMPHFLTENQFLFKNNIFCFQFNAEESFIYTNGIIKHLNP